MHETERRDKENGFISRNFPKLSKGMKPSLRAFRRFIHRVLLLRVARPHAAARGEGGEEGQHAPRRLSLATRSASTSPSPRKNRSMNRRRRRRRETDYGRRAPSRCRGLRHAAAGHGHGHGLRFASTNYALPPRGTGVSSASSPRRRMSKHRLVAHLSGPFVPCVV